MAQTRRPMNKCNHFGSSPPDDSDSTTSTTSTYASVRIDDSPPPTSPITSKMSEADTRLYTSETPEDSPPEQTVRLALEEKFERLYNEFKTRPMRSLNDHEEWSNYLRKELGGRDTALAYYKWVRKQFQKPRPDSSLAALAKSISLANWIHRNNSTEHLNSVIRDLRRRPVREVQDLQYRYDDFRLGLKVGGRPLVPPPTEEDNTHAYGVDLISPGYVLGIRYTHIDNGENQDLIVAPLGRIFFKPMASNDGTGWLDPGLALVANILKDGTAGNLLIVSTAGNHHGEMDEDDPTPTILPDLPNFTVAQLDETVKLVPQSQKDVDQNIRDKLKIESISMPIIVETGVKLDARNPVPIALFPLNKLGQGSEVT
ncbi:hypothetical protein F5Y10DRAFT_269063 [Nemania abortiva]|nr:hypothetical protein F5Y10DRAFT_269063 [Nemania abortiva]